MKKLVILMVLIANILNAIEYDNLSSKEIRIISKHLKDSNRFNLDYIKKVQRTNIKGVYAVHVYLGLDNAITYYAIPSLKADTTTIPHSIKQSKKLISKTFTSAKDFRDSKISQYLNQINLEDEIDNIRAISKAKKKYLLYSTKYSLVMFSDINCQFCKKAKQYLKNKYIDLDIVEIADKSSESEVIKKQYKSNIRDYRVAKKIANKFEIFTTPVFLVFNNKTKKFEDVFTGFKKDYIDIVETFNKKEE